MADIKTNQSKVYNALKGMGFSGIGANEEDFANLMAKPQNREKVYKALTSKGYKGIGKDQAAFDSLIYQAPSAQTQHPQVTEQQKPKVEIELAQPAAVSQPQVTEQPQKPYTPTWQEQMQYDMAVNSAMNTAERVKEDKTLQNLETYRNQQPLAGGVAKSAPKWNPETGKMEQSYITSAGTEHQNQYEAENIQRRLNDAYWREAHPMEAAEREIGQDLRDIRTEEERLTEQRKAAEGNKRPEDKTWWDYFKEGFGASAVTAMAPMGSNVDRDMVEAEMTRKGAYGAERQAIMKEQDVLLARRRLAEEAQQLLTDVRKDQKDYGILGGLGRAGEKVLETALNPRTWDFGEADMASQLAVANAVIKSDSGLGISSNEQKLLDTWAKNAAINSQFGDQLSGWTKAGLVTGESLPFMLEMALNPASGLGEAATKQIVKYSLKKYGTKWVRDHAKSLLAKKIATRLVGDMVGAGVMASTTGMARVAADYENRVTGKVDIGLDANGDVIYNGILQDTKENPGAAFFKALSSTSIENWSEMAGNYLGFLNNFFGKALGKTVIGKAGRKALQTTGSIEGVSLNKAQKFVYELASKGIGALSPALKQFAEKTQWHGVVGEYLEEVMGNIANAAVVGDKNFHITDENGNFSLHEQDSVWNLEDNIDTFCGVALMGGFMSALNTTSYAAHRINYDVDRVNEANAKIFGDELWGDLKTMIDNAYTDPRELNNALTYILGSKQKDENGNDTNASAYSPEEKKAILKYTQAVLEKEGAEMAHYQPRMESSTREEVTGEDGKKQWQVTSVDKYGNTISQQAFDTEDEAVAYEGELKMQQQQQDYKDYLNMSTKLSFSEASNAIDEFLGLNSGTWTSEEAKAEAIAQMNDPSTPLGKQFQQFKFNKVIEKANASKAAIAEFEAQNGWTPGTVQWLSEQDPMQLDAEGLQMQDQARTFLEGLAYPATEVHVEHDQQVGAETAQAVVEEVVSDENMIDPQDNEGKLLFDQYTLASEALGRAYARNEDLEQEVTRLEGMGLSPQEVISSLNSFRPEEVQAVIDFYNAKARYQGFMQEATKQIDKAAANNRQRHTLKGTIDGVADVSNVHTITDGTNTYTLVSGDITTDPATGRITGSASGLIIGLDENGDFVNISDTDGFSVLPVTQTLDQYEEAERNRLGQMVTQVVDPNQTMNPDLNQAGAEEQSGNLDNAGGEAGAENGTGANEPPATAPSSETQQPVEIPVDEKSGLKRYDRGVPVDQAIQDIQNDGFDVNEMADAYIAEAQEAIDKINSKPSKKPQDLIERKRLVDVMDYYNHIKVRFAELNPPAAPAESEENVNVQPEQPIVEEKPVSSQQETEKSEKPTNLTVEEQKQQRIAEAKAKYGELFDDDFTKANDVYELVSMWVGRKRNLAWDDVNGKRGLQKELGWTRKIGGDTKYIETLLAKNGEGMGVDEFVHMVWESPENDIMGEKRFSTEEIKEALLDLLKSAQSKSDVVDYALNTRIAAAETAMQEQQKKAEEEAAQPQEELPPMTAEQIAEMEANMPFAMPTDEDIPDSPIVQLEKVIAELQQQEGMPPIKLVDTDRMSDDEWYDMASAMLDGAFVSQEDIDNARNYVLENGVFYTPESGIIVYSDSLTAEDVRERVQNINDYIHDRVQEEGRNDRENPVVQRHEEGAASTETAEAPAAEAGNGSESKGYAESVTDPYLQPRNEEEKQIIADVLKKLRGEIFAQQMAVGAAKQRYDRKRQEESERATDLFGNDNALNQPGQLFDNSDMPVDQSIEGVERRASAEREAWEAEKAKLERLQSRAERDSRIRGAIDNYRRQTTIEDIDENDTDGILSRVKESGESREVSTPNGTRYEQDYLIDGKHKVTKIDAPNAKGDYPGSQYEYNGRKYGDLNEVVRDIDIDESEGTDPMEAIERTAQEFRKEQEDKKAYGANNKLVTQDRYEDLKKRMKQKLLGQLNSGFDPEILQIGAEMAMFHIEAGARKFADYSTRMINDLGDAVRPYLQSFYEAARRMPGMEELRKEMDSTDFVDNFDVLSYDKQNDNTVNEHKQENNETEKVVSSQEEENLQGDSAEFAERERKIENLRKWIAEQLDSIVFKGTAPMTMQNIKAYANGYGLGDLGLTDLQELVEAEIVQMARDIADTDALNEEQKFENIRRLYERQPSLNARDNDRINKQQYSTPAPMAFLMGQFLSNGKKVESGLEPSAGNGMLTINLPKEKMHVNDIDEMRLSNLQKQGFGEVTSQDGLQSFGEKKYDVVVTNPPFGNVTPKLYDGIYEISGLEHQMSINALESMKDDGRAAIIIGGNTEYNQNGSIKGKDRAFLNYLYAHYNVVDVINMDGKTLYSRQGTGYPVRMIFINGRKQFDPNTFAPVKSKARAEQVKTYDELYKRVNDDILSNANKPASVHNTESGESRRVDDTSNAGGTTQTGVRNVQPEGSKGQSTQRHSDGRGVSRSDNTTNESAESAADANVGGGLSAERGRTETSEPSGTATTEAGGQRPESGGNNTQRPTTPTDNSQRVGQRGTADAQRNEQPQPKRGLGTEKVPYRKQSGNPFTLQSLMPAEQADVVKKSLEELGDVDQFLVDELGYSSKEELHQALAAEQIDSVALAIHQMNQGNAFIIGDQTGIGKGRQAAALIRYGVKKGGFPVFITVKKGLFSDMYRDLCDIGSPKLRPFIWSADDAQHSGNVTDKDGNVIYQMPSAKEQKRVVDYINKHGKLPPEYDYVLTTYDSFKSGTMDYENGQKKARNFGKKQPGAVHFNGQAKRDALETLAGNSFVIMDESHNAGGEGSNVGNYLQYITTRAKGITFLSATFAKRPGNMPIYSLKTAIAKAGVAVSELIDAVKRGGATFQEIMSKALTEAGQMIRRERDMAGVTIDWRGIEDEAVIEKQRQQYDQVIGLFNDIINFQRTYVDPIVDKLNDDAADAQGEVDHTPGTRDMGINNTPFASRTYNMVQQILLSLKAEEAAKRAIEHLKMGHKPVITVANTNEGAADEVASADGESMEMPDLSVNLKKGLRGTLRITRKDAFGNTTNTEIPFDRLSAEGQARYQEILEAIENASTGLSLSPIDVIKNELKKAGYKVGELTGRQAEFVYNSDGTVKRVRRQDTDKKKVAADFNNGKLDALILNRSAGTGISLHASTTFADQRQRVMIVAQAQGDVNDEVQIRGRIDRTGQVLRGMYEYVVSQIPSEQRLLMMLKAKLRSLDANTTSSQKSKFNEMDVQDIINKYGDQIVIQYLAEHTDYAEKMQNPLKWPADWQVMPAEQLIETAQKADGDGATASKVLGRMALLTVTEQEKMLDEIGDLYQAEIDRLNEMGENDLEITEMPLKAKTLSKQVWEQGVDPEGNNPFADNSYVEKVQMDVLKKPMKGSEVKAAQEHLLGGKTWEEYKQDTLAKVDEWAENKKKETTETITERAKKKAEAEKERYIKGAKKAQEKNGFTDEEIEKYGQMQYDTFYNEEMDKLQNALGAIEAQKRVFVDALETFSTDGVYAIPQNIYDLGSMTFEPGFGKLIDIKISSNFSPNASTLSFATLDGRRKITIPINGRVKQQNNEKREIFPVINTLTAQTRHGMFGQNPANTLKVLQQNLDNWDKLTSTAARKEGYIVTGNLLKALVSTREQGVGGKLISFTTDTGEVRQGILMPDNFEPAGLTSKTPISAKKEELKYNGDKVTSADGDVTIKVTNRWNWSTHSYDTLELSVPKSTKKGGKYFNDETLLSLVQGQFEGSSKMRAEFKMDNLDAVLKRLDELGVTVAEEHKEDSSSNRRYDVGEGNSKETQQKSRIASHIDSLLDKLGTKERTTVYHSFDELPEEDKDYVREMERKGRKVRGWYEKGHIYLYLPHIDSEYQAEKTIWHETVAHHGLRELIGAENLDKLLKQLWLTHKDGAMGEWVAERMQKNGWKLNEAIEEYLAREAEKNPFKEPGLWQRLRWMLAEALHKMGFATDPTIADVQYLFWVSQNRISDNNPMSVIKQQAFLHHLEREAANTPYVNMNASTVEDIYNPEAEGAYPDGKTTRHSEETDEEVIERLEKEPKVKVYRAMQLIDGKLYPPMAAKQGGKLVNPIELGKWEKADEHPEMADNNGKFKLDKGNGKSLKAAYNPYIHTSTTMLNDQFSEAQNRDNLVVVECEVPESELTSGYKAEKAKDSVGKMDWKAGIIQGQLSGTREVILSRWDKPVRIVPTEEVAQHIYDMINGKVEVMPTNVVTPQQREALEKLGVKFVETDNRGFIKEGENAGKSYSSVYGKKAGRRYDEDIDNPMEYSAKQVYDERLNRVETVFSEAYQDAMVSLKTAQNAIAQDKDIPDSQNAYMAENLMHGKNKNEQDLYNKMFRDPLINTINKIMNLTGMNWGDIDRYVYTKSGLERNREFFVRDWLEAERSKNAGDKAELDALNDLEQNWIDHKEGEYERLKYGLITYAEYLESLQKFIRANMDSSYNPSKHDYSGFRAMFGDEEGKYSETDIIDELMNTEDAIEAENVDTLWQQINAATQYGLERYREAGMRSDEQIDKIEQMFHFYVPMRGFKEETGEDMYQYFTGKGREKSYLGGLLKHAKGRGSEAQYPISTIFAMSYKAISDCNQNLVNQKLYRLCQANPNDLVILSDSWAVYNDITDEWEESSPDIPEDASEEEVREITLAWEDSMRQLALAKKAKKIHGKAEFDYKPIDKKKQSEHIVDVRINGQPKKMIVTGNPRMAQALNGQLRFERGHNVLSKWNAAIKNFMASLFTSYSPTFALRNMFRDWTHFRMMLGVREGHGYAAQANKYYRQSLFKMVGLFKKYREGKLDESKEIERDFKDFMDNGGITGFVMMQKIDDIQKEMENIYKKQKAGKPIRLNNNLWEKILGAVEALNEGIENNARFATYRASRHYAGRTKSRSAYDAKEITVNFNRKGAGGKTAGFKSQSKMVEDAAKAFGVTSQILGEGRIFFNATVQAIATTFKNFQNPDGTLNKKYIAKWAAKYAIPPFMFGLLLPAINMALANAFGGDDDDPYANLPEWTRRKNICIYIGHNNFITIPVGQELAAFLALGDIVAGNTYAPDLKPVDRSLFGEMVEVMNTFSPVDVSTKITKGGLMEDPISEVTGRTFSVLAPLVAVEQNLGWTGRPIYREDKFQNDQYTPEYQMVYQSTNPVLVNASKLLHELGGGDDITRGKLEVNPAIIQYLWEQYTGGPGKVFSNTISIGKDAKDILTGNESDFNIRKVEGLKAFVSQGDDRTQYYRTQAKYRKYSEDAKKLYHDVKGYENAATTDPTALMKLEKISQSEDFVRMQIVREADKQLSQINKAANKAEGKEKKELRRLYNKQVKAVVDMLDEVGQE